MIAAKAAADQARETELNAMTPHEKEVALYITQNGVADAISKYGGSALIDLRDSVVYFGITDGGYDIIKPSYQEILDLNKLGCMIDQIDARLSAPTPQRRNQQLCSKHSKIRLMR